MSIEVLQRAIVTVRERHGVCSEIHVDPPDDAVLPPEAAVVSREAWDEAKGEMLAEADLHPAVVVDRGAQVWGIPVITYPAPWPGDPMYDLQARDLPRKLAGGVARSLTYQDEVVRSLRDDRFYVPDDKDFLQALWFLRGKGFVEWEGGAPVRKLTTLGAVYARLLP